MKKINGKKEYCLKNMFIKGNMSPTKKFPDQLATLIAAIIIGLGPTSVNSKKKIKQNKNNNNTIDIFIYYLTNLYSIISK